MSHCLGLISATKKKNCFKKCHDMLSDYIYLFIYFKLLIISLSYHLVYKIIPIGISRILANRWSPVGSTIYQGYRMVSTMILAIRWLPIGFHLVSTLIWVISMMITAKRWLPFGYHMVSTLIPPDIHRNTYHQLVTNSLPAGYLTITGITVSYQLVTIMIPVRNC